MTALVLPPLDTPCALCRHQRAEADEWDDDAGVALRVCTRCANDGELGRRLPRASYLVVHSEAASATTETLGLYWTVSSDGAAPKTPSIVAIANLREPDSLPLGVQPGLFWRRRLLCHVPTNFDGDPLWFEHIAKHSQGDALLGVLKADADSVGAVLDESLHGSTSIRALSSISRQLDDFFAGRLKHELESNTAWQSIYTVFGGGDDLLLVGPWNVMFDFAGKINELFYLGFKRWRLTLSAGLALAKWKRPIKFAAAQAEDLLQQAKTATAPDESTAKDQLAALGQVWKWKHHAAIVGAGKRLVGWVDDESMPRGWLHTLLELAESRFGDPATGRVADPLATARLAHHVVRNYPSGTEIRRWGDTLVDDFDTCQRVETRYLPAIVRYALTATRNPSKEE
ncbi:MAG: hypothetical protein HYU36_01780 [Planctomycetes bacterium]|nr:hypothetical protein [Planctomycetota bacterium]